MKSYLLNILHKVSENVYGFCSGFFEGKTSGDPGQQVRFEPERNYVYTWQLNQGIEDIALKDFQALASSLIPGMILRKLARAHAWYSIFYLTDDIYISENKRNIENYPVHGPHTGAGYRILSSLTKDKRVKRCISFFHAVRYSLRKISKAILPEKSGSQGSKVRQMLQVLSIDSKSSIFQCTFIRLTKLPAAKLYHKRN
jgi:hypothetical protein